MSDLREGRPQYGSLPGRLVQKLRKRPVLAGALLWLLFCCVLVPIRGVRWDEQYEMAQVVTHQVPYPENHPLYRCTRGALNLQIYLSAAVLECTDSEALVCGARNAGYLMATALPVFLLAAALSRRVWMGHAAALLALVGIHEDFYGCYRMFAWPAYNSTGHIGRGCALVVLWLLIAGHWRAGFLLLGLMPCIHGGQAPLLAAFTLLLTVSACRSGERDKLVRALPWAGIGLAACAVLWSAHRVGASPAPTEGPYFSSADPWDVWRAYLREDPHRALPGGVVRYTNGFIALGGALLLTVAAARIEKHRGTDGRWRWLFAYVACAAVAVWGIMAIHAVSREHPPYLLLSWMPYRFTNHATMILLAGVCAVLAGARGDPDGRSSPGWILLALALAYGIARPRLAAIVPDPHYTRYVATGQGVLFFLGGAAFATLLRGLASRRRFLWCWAAFAALGYVAVLLHHQFGAFTFACGAATLATLSSRAVAPRIARLPRRAAPATILTLSVILVAAVTYREWRGRQWLPRTPFDKQTVVYLDARGEADPMVLTRPDQYSVQARTGHPVMADDPLAGWIPYMPSLGPSIQKMYGDLYGFRFGQPSTRSWPDTWQTRTRDEWRQLAGEYGFRYVLAPAHLHIDLLEVLRAKGLGGQMETLYHAVDPGSPPPYSPSAGPNSGDT